MDEYMDMYILRAPQSNDWVLRKLVKQSSSVRRSYERLRFLSLTHPFAITRFCERCLASPSTAIP